MAMIACTVPRLREGLLEEHVHEVDAGRCDTGILGIGFGVDDLAAVALLTKFPPVECQKFGRQDGHGHGCVSPTDVIVRALGCGEGNIR